MKPALTPPTKRFYIHAPLTVGARLPLPENLSHRLRHVLRMEAGSTIHLFNGLDGLFEASLEGKKLTDCTVLRLISPPAPLPPLIVAVGLPKREAWETVLRQATEMGATRIVPLRTQFSQVDKMGNPQRVQTLLVEAAEQCERLSLPELTAPQELTDFVASLTTPCAWAYERKGNSPATPLPAACHTVLVGPEGGFSPQEVALLAAHPLMVPLSLGPTILRVDTAVVAGLARVIAPK